jgi:phenylpyruvate tautomerase PptA (4-oxalocrotonate tautomerase family)
MPLVRIDLVEGRTTDEVTTLLDTVQDCVVEAFEVPEDDRYQIVTEHPAGRMVIRDTGLGFTRTDKVTVVHIFTSPRTPAMKTTLYSLLAERLEDRCGIAPSDLVISVATNGVDDWSFGDGEAQYLTGRL